MKKIALAILTLILLVEPVSADDFQDGKDAYKRSDYKTALEKWKPLAEQGNANGQNGLGVLYANGQGVAQDYREAVKWYRLSAEQGVAKAQYNLGVMYAGGQGVAQDYKEALKWYRLSAEQGFAPAQYNLGLMYAKGKRVTQDDKEKEAVKWNDKEAVKWFRLSAEQGDAEAQLNLGWMYGNGRGVPQDFIQAHKWYNLAEANGHEDGYKGREIFEKLMTPAQIAQAQEMTRQWLASNKNKGKEPGPQTSVISAQPAPGLPPPNTVPGGKQSIMTAGTGFSLGSSSYILTNYHVVRNAKLIKIKYLSGESAIAEVIVKDESSDIAFLKPESFSKLPGANISLGDSTEMRLGDKVFTIGFPMSNILGQQPRYSEGVINSLAGVGDDPKVFQVSIPIQKGNSGGPLFNQKGEVVGIVSSSLDSANTFQVFGNAPQNVNFAIKSTFVKNLLPMIPDALISPTDIVVVPKDSGSLSSFIERVKNNIVLIEAEY
jgi:uncharacterized protein